MEKSAHNVSVVFPAHNEENNIEPCVVVAQALLNEFVDDFEIILVDDGSTDATPERMKKLEQRFNGKVKTILFPENRGYGRAIAAGFAQARCDLLFFSDSDRQFDILNLRDLLEQIDSQDIVVGYRKDRQDPLMRRFLSWGYNHVVRRLFGITVKDIDCAFKLFRKTVFENIAIESSHYFINTEILAKASFLNMRISQVGVSHFPRIDDASKVSLADIPRTLRELRRIRRKLKSMKEGADERAQ